MTKPEKMTDLLVVGGGVLGAFHAHAALQHGRSVVLLERSSIPSGATVRNFGQIVPSGLDHRWQPLGRESVRIYQSIQKHFDISVRSLGSIYIASDDEELGLIEELHQINGTFDYSSELWTAERCCQRYPQLRGKYCRAGLFFPDEVSVNPRQMIHRLHQYLNQQPNYRSHFQTGVRELAVDDHGHITAVTTDGQAFTAENAILCCGHEFQWLYPKLFQTSDLKAVKLQMLRLRPQSDVSIPGNVLTGLSIRRYESFSQCPSWDTIKSREESDSFDRKWGIHILFKQEADGGIILGDSHEYAAAADVDHLSFDIHREINEHFITEGRKIFDLPHWDVESSWCGSYCQTADPSGIFTRTIDDRIHIVTGIGGKGMTSSAGFARHKIEELYND